MGPIHYRASILRAATVAFLLSVAAGQSQAGVIFGLANPDPYRNGSWAFGQIFTVAAQDLAVTALGAFDDLGNGFATSGGIPVGIYRESDGTLLTSTSVLSTDPLVGNYRYGSIAPLILSSGQQYRVVAVNRDDRYNISFDYSVNPLVSYDGYGYAASTALTRADVFQGNERIWMANFDASVVVGAPEASSLVIWGVIAAGMTVGQVYRRRVNSHERQTVS